MFSSHFFKGNTNKALHTSMPLLIFPFIFMHFMLIDPNTNSSLNQTNKLPYKSLSSTVINIRIHIFLSTIFSSTIVDKSIKEIC